MSETSTKEDRRAMRLVGQDIRLFLRLASQRIAEKPDVLPFKPQNGQVVVGWLQSLAERYANGEDILT